MHLIDVKLNDDLTVLGSVFISEQFNKTLFIIFKISEDVMNKLLVICYEYETIRTRLIQIRSIVNCINDFDIFCYLSFDNL